MKLHASKSRFFLIFFNLLNNSLKFSQKLPVADLRKQYDPDIRDDNRERRMQIDIFVDILPEFDPKFPGGLEIKFCDYGPGIDPRLDEIIFEEGVRESRWNATVRGEGIGLWVVRRIVRAHGGEITLTKNELPTTFCIQFPKEIFNIPTQ
jgi:signal transduction histidine kinase